MDRKAGILQTGSKRDLWTFTAEATRVVFGYSSPLRCLCSTRLRSGQGREIARGSAYGERRPDAQRCFPQGGVGAQIPQF
jgi:hypothetical protein